MFQSLGSRGTIVRTLAAAFIVGSLSIGVAYAATSTPPATSSPTMSVPAATPGQSDVETTDTGTQDQQPSPVDSILALQTNDKPGHPENSAALQSQAKISNDQAKTAALARFPGATVQTVTLDDENGSVVYSVNLTDSAGKSQVVKVDAGNATVLNVEADGGEGTSATESTGTAESADAGN